MTLLIGAFQCNGAEKDEIFSAEIKKALIGLRKTPETAKARLIRFAFRYPNNHIRITLSNEGGDVKSINLYYGNAGFAQTYKEVSKNPEGKETPLRNVVMQKDRFIVWRSGNSTAEEVKIDPADAMMCIVETLDPLGKMAGIYDDSKLRPKLYTVSDKIGRITLSDAAVHELGYISVNYEDEMGLWFPRAMFRERSGQGKVWKFEQTRPVSIDASDFPTAVPPKIATNPSEKTLWSALFGD